MAHGVNLWRRDIEGCSGIRYRDLGTTVQNDRNEKIGTLDDIIISSDKDRVQFAILQVGGFLGLGGKTVAVTYDSLNISRNAKGDAIDHVTIAATKDDLLRAASFKSLRQQLAQVREGR